MRLFNFIKSRKGQATTEVVLLFPIFFILTLFIIKMYCLLIVVQKAEIASFYAAKRWQLESHRATKWAEGWDNTFLKKDIEKKVSNYLGFNNPSTKKFLALKSVKLEIERTNVWNNVTLTVKTRPPALPFLCSYNVNQVCKPPYGMACQRGYNYLCVNGGSYQVVKSVPNRDRPFAFRLPYSKPKQ